VPHRAEHALHEALALGGRSRADQAGYPGHASPFIAATIPGIRLVSPLVTIFVDGVVYPFV
jgi:hypothetical protein